MLKGFIYIVTTVPTIVTGMNYNRGFFFFFSLKLCLQNQMIISHRHNDSE